ncbi:hypothetical protein ABEX38_29145 [Priestia megaterium]
MDINSIILVVPEKESFNFLKDLAPTIIALIALLFSYLQIRQIKEADKKQDKKIAVDNSIMYVDRFAKEVLPHYQEYKTLIHQGIIKAVQISGTGFTDFNCDEIHDLDKKEKTDIYKKLNELDIIATALLHGQVDKEISKDMIGTLFCEAVEVYYDVICYLRKDSPQHLKMTVQLYTDWRGSFSTVQSPVNLKGDNSLKRLVSGD